MNMLRTTLIASAFAAILGVGNVIASEPDRSLGETIDDASITAAVKTELLADKRTEGFDINVDTRNGNVTLRGGADTLADKLAATELARKVKGVRSVDNDIVIAADGSERRQDANTATAWVLRPRRAHSGALSPGSPVPADAYPNGSCRVACGRRSGRGSRRRSQRCLDHRQGEEPVARRRRHPGHED